MANLRFTRRKLFSWFCLGAVYLLPFITVIGASDIYLKVDSIKGEAIEQQYEDWIEGTSLQFGVSRAIGSRGEGPPSRPSVTIGVTKQIDRSSPLLFREAAVGGPRVVELDLLKTTADIRQRYYKVKLYDAFVTGMSVSASANSINDSVTFDFTRMDMTYTEYVGSKTGKTTSSWYDVAEGKGGDGVFPFNSAPTISAISAGTGSTPEETPLTVSFTIGDAQTPASSLGLSASSSNPTLVSVGGISLGGSGTNRTATITPALNQTGASTITIQVSDGVLTASSSFTLTVTPVNDAPTAPTIPSKVTNVNTPFSFSFTINDVDAGDSLTATASSSNQTLIPNGGLAITGTGTNRTFTITPASNQVGTATITLVISDGALTATNTFSVTVQQPTPQTPTDILLSNSSVRENSTNGTAIGTLSAVDADSASHMFTLIDSAGGRFKIQGSQLLVDATGLLDFENAATHQILVKATDPGGLEFSKTLLISVLNVNEAPTFIVSDNSVIETIAGRSTAISRLQISDPDAGSSSISLNLRVVNGVLNVSSNFSGTITSNGTAEVTLLGSLANLNAVLSTTNGLLYRAITNVSGTDILTATVNDNGHSGLGTNLVVFTTLGIHFYQSQYVQWLSSVFTGAELNNAALEGSLWGLDADPDNDGMDNLAEYALGTNPRQANSKPTASFVTKGDQKFLSLELDCRHDPDLSLSVEVSGDVGDSSWSSGVADLEVFPPVNLSTGFEHRRFDDRTSRSSASRRFMRMRWTLQNAP